MDKTLENIEQLIQKCIDLFQNQPDIIIKGTTEIVSKYIDASCPTDYSSAIGFEYTPPEDYDEDE